MGFKSHITKMKQLVLDTLPEPAIIIDEEGRVVAVNRSWLNEQPHGEDIYENGKGKSCKEFFKHSPQLQTGIKDVMTGIRMRADHQIVVNHSNIKRTYDIRVLPMTDSSSKASGVLLIYCNGKTQNKGEHLKKKDAEFYQIIADHSKDMIKVTDIHGNVEYASPSHELYLGYIDQSNIFEYIHPDDHEHLRSLYNEILKTKEPCQLEFRKMNKDKQWLWVEAVCSPVLSDDETVENVLIISRDTSERKQMQFELEHMAFHDYLTGLYNRRKMRITMEDSLSESSYNGEKFAILVMDLDKFKLINDTHGHDIGDLVLKEVAQRLLRSKRENDVVGRLSGDEFVVVMKGISAIEEIQQYILSMQNVLNDTFNIPDVELEIMIRSSAGYSMYPDHGDSVKELFKNADLALYKEKKRRIKLVKSVPMKITKLKTN